MIVIAVSWLIKPLRASFQPKALGMRSKGQFLMNPATKIQLRKRSGDGAQW
jgi:hypothetical protein